MPRRVPRPVAALALYLLAWHTGVSGLCQENQQTCRDGKGCYIQNDRCNGGNRCEDGTDEDLEQCENESVNLEVGKSVLVHLNYILRCGPIMFSLCSKDTCTIIELFGMSRSKRLKAVLYYECNKWRTNCKSTEQAYTIEPPPHNLPEGEMTFKVRHLPAQLVIHLDGYLVNTTVTAKTLDGQNRLRVWAYYGTAGDNIRLSEPEAMDESEVKALLSSEPPVETPPSIIIVDVSNASSVSSTYDSTTGETSSAESF